MSRRYLTTPLYYVNARPHLGHSYTTILTDVLKRHFAQRGDDVTFLTGTDEHGEKIEQMARKEGRDVREFVTEIAKAFETTWRDMGLHFDIFYRTTDPTHVRRVQHALSDLKERGEIVFREYEGKYCVGCERFLTDTELVDGKCPDHLTVPELRKEANYFFLMGKYRDAIAAHFEKHTDAIEPAHYRNEILSFLKQPLGDLCISRPTSRLQWGIPLPFDDKFVTYVWFDALLNYLCATGWPDKFDEKLWSESVHLIGKDILKTHAVYWPAMLLSLGVPIFKRLEVNGFVLVSGTKMSKSLGNVIRPLEVEALYGRETLRFYLLKEISYGLDSTFTVEGFIQSVNAHLANGIGNLVSRVLTLCQNGYSGTRKRTLTDRDRAALAERALALKAWDDGFGEWKYQNAMKAWGDLVTKTDLYVNEMKPWALAKDPAQADRLETVLWVCLKMIQAAGAIVYPVLPEASGKIMKALGISSTPNGPSLSLVTDDAQELKVSTEVPRLFARIAKPTEDQK